MSTHYCTGSLKDQIRRWEGELIELRALVPTLTRKLAEKAGELGDVKGERDSWYQRATRAEKLVEMLRADLARRGKNRAFDWGER